jgi:UPF0716 protein FxsA
VRVLAGLSLLAIAEIAVFVAVAEWWSAAAAVLLLAGLSLLGFWVLRRTGAAWRRRMTELAQTGGGLRVDDGALAVRWFAGLLLLVPGLLTGLAGLVLLLPPVSRAVQRRTSRRLLSSMASFNPGGVTITGEVFRADWAADDGPQPPDGTPQLPR